MPTMTPSPPEQRRSAGSASGSAPISGTGAPSIRLSGCAAFMPSTSGAWRIAWIRLSGSRAVTTTPPVGLAERDALGDLAVRTPCLEVADDRDDADLVRAAGGRRHGPLARPVTGHGRLQTRLEVVVHAARMQLHVSPLGSAAAIVVTPGRGTS